jgi:hypothetical protein
MCHVFTKALPRPRSDQSTIRTGSGRCSVTTRIDHSVGHSKACICLGGSNSPWWYRYTLWILKEILLNAQRRQSSGRFGSVAVVIYGSTMTISVVVSFSALSLLEATLSSSPAKLVTFSVDSPPPKHTRKQSSPSSSSSSFSVWLPAVCFLKDMDIWFPLFRE